MTDTLNTKAPEPTTPGPTTHAYPGHDHTKHPHGFGLVPQPFNVPPDLHAGNWCAWVASPREGKPGKFDKVPHNGRKWISTAEPAEWLDFSQAVALYQANPTRFNGIGRLIQPGDGLVFVDYDAVTDDLKQWVIDYMPTYIELSPSGTGLRLVSKGKVSREVTRRPTEVYQGESPRFVTITGHALTPHPVADVSGLIQTAIVDDAAPEATQKSNDPRPPLLSEAEVADVIPLLGEVPPDCDRSAEMQRRANRALIYRVPPQEVFTALYYSPWMDVALDKRRQDTEKALDYLWEYAVLSGEGYVSPVQEVDSLPPTTPQAAADRLPMLILPSNNFQPNESADKIFESIAQRHGLYLHGGRVCIVRGTQLEIVSPEMFVSILPHYGRLLSHRSAGPERPLALGPAKCSMENARVLLAAQATEKLPQVDVLSLQPVISYDGVVLARGFHRTAKGGVLVLADGGVPAVPLTDAVAALRGLLVDFQFTGPGDESRAVAAFLTPALVASFQFPAQPPMFEVEADHSQTGKDYMLMLVRTVYGEVASTITQRRGRGVGSLDEDIGSALVSGQRFILLGNIRGSINSPTLEAVLTSEDPVLCRIPHKGAASVDPRRVNVHLTSNGFTATKDLANRACIVRLLKQARDYQWKQWPEGETRDHVQTHQRYYLGCVFSVVQEWIRQGRPGIRADHDRRYWSDPMNWIVQRLFGLPDLMSDHESAKDRIGDPGMEWLRRFMIEATEAELLSPDEAYRAEDIAKICQELALPVVGVDRNRDADPEPSAMFRRIGGIMGKVFRKQWATTVTGSEARGYGEHHRAVIDRFVVERWVEQRTVTVGSGVYTGKAIHKPTKVYRFSVRTNAVTPNQNSGQGPQEAP